MNHARSSSIKAIGWALVTISLFSCAPAKWMENPGAGGNTGSGAPDPINPAPRPSATPVQGPKAIERFEQDQNANKIDILIVNDDSSSMEEEQKKMAERFGSFVSALSTIDYRIAMTTTDLQTPKWNQNGRIMEWSGTGTKVLTPKTPNAEGAFRSTIKRNETIGCRQRSSGKDCPSGNEEPLRATLLAIDQRANANKDLFRVGVDFVVVVLSDEDELSDGPVTATKPIEVTEGFEAAFGVSKRLAVHGIIVKPGDVACKAEQEKQIKEPGGAFYGQHVSELAALTNGTTGSICATDYAKNLSAISDQVRKLVSSFDLQKEPLEGSVEVNLTPNDTIAFHVEGKRVIFARPPNAGTRVEISYSVK
ncbi:MAG: hypothetical protein V4760_19875 [Bdellovibrionota bacterium]